MLISDDKTQEAKSAAQDGSVVEEAPPGYEDSTRGGSTSQPRLNQPPPDIQSTNFLLISRGHESIKGTWVIDPALSIPTAILPPLEEGEERLNLKVESTYSSVNGNVWVVPSSTISEGPIKPATLLLKSSHGSVRTKIYRADLRQPLALTSSSSYGSVHLALPRSFRGPTTFSTSYGSVRFSEAVAARMCAFSEVDGVRRGFIGDYAEWIKDPDAWTGDRVTAESGHGTLRVSFSDEEESEASSAVAGFFSRLFGAR